jgi:indole-3-glycerol phosphate synthase/phosphoribosylanthranilate isomerase
MALDEILKHKREELAARVKASPLEHIKKGLEPSELSLADALRGDRKGFILECKRSSPSKGVIRNDYDAAKLAQDLAEHADAISVLTDERFFGGSLGDLRAVSESIPCPVLRKDFIIDPYQVYESRAYGADAILIIMAALGDAKASECMKAAEELGMDALVEVHDEAELRRALGLGAKIIGINSRNLRTLEIDLKNVEKLARLVPDDVTVVAESGVKSHSDVRRLCHHADAFLVGTAVMEREDVAQAAREIVYGRVKVCGLTSPEDAGTARNSGATFGGMIFVEGSPRRIDRNEAKAIASSANLKWVGVFANSDEAFVAQAVRELDLHALQLHGDEDDDYIERLKGALPERVEVWRARRVGRKLPDMGEGRADRILLDTYVEGKGGGTGKSFDWSLLAGRELGRIILSGGLNPDNASEADSLGTYALDVNSGIESAPGKKDRKLIDEFFSNLRGGGRRART